MIQIHILRISADGLFLEFNVECPIDYRFNLLEITRYDPVTKLDEAVMDLSVIFLQTNNTETVRLATNIFGEDTTMYKVRFVATKIDDVITQEAIGYCSNISFVYQAMIDLVMQLTASCISKADAEALNRNHIMIYAHQEAMRLERILDAKFFYDIIWNQFTNCGSSGRQPGIITGNCNCI